MDALTPAEIFALRRTEQLVALDDLRNAQRSRVVGALAALTAPVDLLGVRQLSRREARTARRAATATGVAVVETAR